MKALFFISLLYIYLFSNTVYIISNKNIQTSKKELKKFFVAKSNYLNGSKFKRVSNKESIKLFSQLAFEMSAKKLSEKWIKQNFRRGTPFPLTLQNDIQTIKWIKLHPKTVGFVMTKPIELPIIYIFKD